MPVHGSAVELVEGRLRAVVPAKDVVHPGEEAGHRVAGYSQAMKEDVVADGVVVLHLLDWNTIQWQAPTDVSVAAGAENVLAGCP